ncbi:ankyrin repeat and KH domain-containing protein 1-like isoform 1-T4 [Salvelinus alpinus]|nr:ankyrin repeat and KH domain-containing protein 1-like [Salvelinus alpinus]
MVVPPQETDRVPSNITTPPSVITKSVSDGFKQRLSPFQGNPLAADGPDTDLLPLFYLYQHLECIVEETESKLNELSQRISAIEKAELQKKKIPKEKFTKEYMKAKGLKGDPGQPLLL